MDAEADVISLYGVPAKLQVTQDQMKQIATALKTGRATFSRSLANLQVRDNIVSSMKISADIFRMLDAVASGNANTLERLFRRCFITGNVFKGGSNEFVMEHLALTSNTFDRVPDEDAGVVVADASTYVSTHAPDDIRLFNVSRASAKAANLVINIVDV